MKRSRLEICVKVMEALQTKELIISNLDRKTGINFIDLNAYVEFLKSKNYVGSKGNKTKASCGKKSEIYFLGNSGMEFLKRWYNFRKNYDIDSLEKQI